MCVITKSIQGLGKCCQSNTLWPMTSSLQHLSNLLGYFSFLLVFLFRFLAVGLGLSLEGAYIYTAPTAKFHQGPSTTLSHSGLTMFFCHLYDFRLSSIPGYSYTLGAWDCWSWSQLSVGEGRIHYGDVHCWFTLEPHQKTSKHFLDNFGFQICLLHVFGLLDETRVPGKHRHKENIQAAQRGVRPRMGDFCAVWQQL